MRDARHSSTPEQVATAYGRFRFALEAGHTGPCALVFGRAALMDRPSLSMMAACVCGLRQRILAQRDPLTCTAALEQLTTGELAERASERRQQRPFSQPLRAG